MAMWKQPVARLPGLERLLDVDELKIKQETFQLFGRTYYVANDNGQQLFSIVSKALSISNDMQLCDNSGNEIVHFGAPIDCSGLFTGFQSVTIAHASGTPLGSVKYQYGLLNRTYKVCDANDQPIFKVGRKSAFSLGDVDYHITSVNGSLEVGKITNVWTAWGNKYRITFPRDLALEMKAALLGAWVFIEKEARDSRRRRK